MAKQYFHGFESGEAKGKGRLRMVERKADPARPAIHRLRDAIALPGHPALYSLDGALIAEARPFTLSSNAPESLSQKFLAKAPKPIKVPGMLGSVRETVLFGGYLRTHYGHFLIDCMSRLWARDRFPDLPILFTSDWPTPEQPAFSKEILSALGLTSRLLQVDEPTLFRDVIIPGTAFEYRWKVFAIADEPHLAAGKKLGGGRTWPLPVYLTRSGLPDEVEIKAGTLQRMRKADGELELEAELFRRGFEIVMPETLPLADQISLFREAPAVVGTTSSAFHTSLFSRAPDLRLAFLSWGKGNENDWLIDAIKPHTSHYIKSLQLHETDGRLIMDVGLTLSVLKDAGLIAH